MRSHFACVSMVLAALAPMVAPQPAAVAPAAPAAPVEPPIAEGMDPIAMMRQMGADEGAIMMLQLLSQAAGMDLGQAMMLFMLADQGNIDDDVVGMLLLSKALGGGGAKQPAALLAGDSLLVVEDGVVYKIDIGKMEAVGSVAYRPTAKATGLPAALMPMLQGAQENAQLTACTSNMKQLCLAALMYSQENNDTLPTEDWVEAIYPYCKNRAMYVCPGQPDKKVAYALNEAIAGVPMAEVKSPAQAVLLFEADLPDDAPFGGADAVPEPPRHGDRIVVGFVDGHVKAVSPDELRELLQRNPFE